MRIITKKILFLIILFFSIKAYAKNNDFNFKAPVIYSSVFYSISLIHYTASIISGNYYLSNTNKSNTAIGVSSIVNYAFALGSFTVPSALLIKFLVNYIKKYPDDYFNNKYIKVRNALIITLVSNSFLWNVSTVLCLVYLIKLNYSEPSLFNYIIISNSSYTSGITFLTSLFLSIAIIIKHCLYKKYHSKKLSIKNKVALVYPIIGMDLNKKFTLGVTFVF